MAERNINKPYSHRRWHDDIGGRRVICSFCKHRRNYDEGKSVLPCDAFPEGISHEWITVLSKSKFRSEECNNGVRFEVAEKDKDNYEEYLESEDW